MRTIRNPTLIMMMLAVIHSSSLLGQKQPEPPSRPEIPVDSARWWTLSDEISPQQLRAIHEDVELHKERYRAAASMGERPTLSKGKAEPPSFFIDGKTHPELFQMWVVFSSFAAGFAYDEIDPRVSLADFGFEQEALEKIAALAIDFWHKREALQGKLEEEMKAVADLARHSRENLGSENFAVAIKARDTTMLASATGYSVERVEELLKMWWKETPAEDLTVQTLPLIRKALGPNVWEQFRSYLLEVQAPKMSAVGYAEIYED